ncbi:RNA-binding S4 domain-containing protein [Helicobacter sp. 23-1048]
MRVDKFLNATNVLKRRTLAQDMCENGVVLINGAKAKSSKEVKIGDIITINFLESQKQYEVLALPTTKNVPKSQSQMFVKLL